MTDTRSPKPIRRRIWMALIPACVLLAATGCNWLMPLVFMAEHKEKVPAEFDKLADTRTAIVVWAQQETLFDYPHVRLELAMHIADQLRPKVKFDLVDGRKVEDYLQRTLATAADPETVGRHFDCDMVIYLELLEFQIRDPQAPDFLRATIHASVSVYDIGVAPDEPRRYALQDVETIYPEQGPVTFTGANAAQVRKAAYETFAEAVARKFYNHERAM